MRRKSPKFYKRPPLLNAPSNKRPLKIEKFNKRPGRLIEVVRYPMFDDLRNVNDYASADLFLP